MKRDNPKPSTVYVSRDGETYSVQVYDAKGILVRENKGMSTRMYAQMTAARTAAIRGFDLIDETKPPKGELPP